jgi:hypothetical protein
MPSTPNSLLPRAAALLELVSLGFATIGVRATLAAISGELLVTLPGRNRRPIQARKPV